MKAVHKTLRVAVCILLGAGLLMAVRQSLQASTIPTGQKTTMSGMSMVRMANHKIAEIWTAFTPST